MAKFSASALKKDLQNKANEAVRSEKVTRPISDKAKQTMHKVIKEKVYDSYSSKVYERRGEYGGLIDLSNIIVTINGNHIILENIAEPNESLFGTPLRENPQGLLYQWIDEGRIGMPSSLDYPNGLSPWRGKRMGLTDDIANDFELKDFIGDIITKNIK